MGTLIGAGNSNNFGENYFIDRAKAYLDDSHIIYWNRQLFGREFDVCVLMPEKGILVVELKGWREETVLGLDGQNQVVIQTEEGERALSPQKQARGYRFSLERYIRQNLGKLPLVFHMVGLPQISRAFYRAHRLDVAMEERFTFLKEDLENNAAFFHKLDQALREVTNWHRDSFDRQTMWQVRGLFEADVGRPEGRAQDQAAVPCRRHDYSRLYYLPRTEPLSDRAVAEMLEQYFLGCKLYCVFEDQAELCRLAGALDEALTRRGLRRDGENIALDLEETSRHLPPLSPGAEAFQAFHCEFSLLSAPFDPPVPAFCVVNGAWNREQERWIQELAGRSIFNAEQYRIEHAPPEKHVVVSAGAGTGKTHTMIARVGFICYTQNVPLVKMAERIVMITFTNEAADNMAEKLKRYFRNCCLVTSRVEYLDMVAQIDHMQISTIHAYAKQLIVQLGTSFGYGVDFGVTSSNFYRSKKISSLLDSYIRQKARERGPGYADQLGMPVYAIRDSILDFIGKLHNKSVDISAIAAGDFGTLPPGDPHGALHELLSTLIPQVEREYRAELLENNQVHLSSMMSMLSRFIAAPESRTRIRELKKDRDARQFLFVDEFQDTDDTQIEMLLTLAELLDYSLFVVGDVKQCIYRFRGAQEKAFDQLGIGRDSSRWVERTLRRNYRTDSALLDRFDRVFQAWGGEELLTYTPAKDRLLGTRDYNSGLLRCPEEFYRRIEIAAEGERIPKLIEEIRRLQRRVEGEKGGRLSARERSIAVLVRENWQAELVRLECARQGIEVQTNTGGDLYQSQPALDMMILVNALIHFDEADYLYQLTASNFFALDIPKSNLYALREKLRAGGPRAKAEEREQVNYMIQFINPMLANKIDQANKWEYVVKSLRTQPVLQVLRRLYSTLEPWRNFSQDSWKQHYYQLNVDLLFEQLINACNVDKLTVNTLGEYLCSCIVSRASVDSRKPAGDGAEAPVRCVTVHKAKGLEYGHVILPFCSAPIDRLKNARLHVSTEQDGGGMRIGYRLNLEEQNQVVQNSCYNENLERSEKSREEARILYVAMTRAIRSFSWIEWRGNRSFSWQRLLETEG